MNLLDRDHQKNTQGSILWRRLLFRQTRLQKKDVHRFNSSQNQKLKIEINEEWIIEEIRFIYV